MSEHARHRASKRRRGWVLAVLATAIVVLTAWRLTAAPADSPTTSSPPDASESPTGGTETPAARTRVIVDPAGDVEVRMDVVLTDARSTLNLVVPERAGTAAEFAPEVHVVSVRVAGEEIEVDTYLMPGQRTTVELGTETTELEVEYDATGTWVESEPSTAGRGLVLLTPLFVEDADAASPVEVTDQRILNLACAEDTRMRTCGELDGQSWTAARTATEDVIAQLDLA